MEENSEKNKEKKTLRMSLLRVLGTTLLFLLMELWLFLLPPAASDSAGSVLPNTLPLPAVAEKKEEEEEKAEESDGDKGFGLFGQIPVPC